MEGWGWVRPRRARGLFSHEGQKCKAGFSFFGRTNDVVRVICVERVGCGTGDALEMTPKQ